MPIMRCSRDGKPGFSFGESGFCYTYTPADQSSLRRARSLAERQERAIRASGYVEKEANLSPRDSAGEANALSNVANELKPVTQSALTSGLLKFRERVSLIDLENAIERGGAANIEDAIPFEFLTEDLSAIDRVTEEGIIRGGNRSSEFLKRAGLLVAGAAILRQFAFDSRTPAVQREIFRSRGILGAQLEQTSRQAVRNAVVQAQLNQLSSGQTAKLVQQSIGLTSRQATAVANFRSNLEIGRIGKISSLARGVVASRIGSRDLRIVRNREAFLAAADRKSLDQMANSYAERLLRDRSENIARTESFRAASAGQALLWDQAADQGLFDRVTARKRWHVAFDERTCPICSPLEGIEVPIDGTFPGGYDRPPDPHSRCRCHVSLILS